MHLLTRFNGLFALLDSDSDSDFKTMATEYYAEHGSIARTRTWILIPFPNGYCTHFRDKSLSQLHTFQSGDHSPNLNQ